MASNDNITTTYVGKDSGQFITPVVFAGRTLGVPGVTIHNNVNYRTRLTKIELDSLIKGATCNFDAAGTIDQTEVWLEVTQLEVNLELCKSNYFVDFIGEDMGPADGLPARFLTFLLGAIGGNVADAIEKMVWNGDGTGAPANSFEGFEPKFVADAAVVKVGTPVAIDASNVIAEIRRTVAAGKAELIGRSDTYIYMGSRVYQSLKEANNDKNAASPCGEDCVAVDGITVFLAPGMQDGAMAFAQKSNLHFGTWMSSDLTKIKAVDMSEWLEDNVRLGMSFFAGVEYGIGEEIVYYPPAP